MWTRPVAPSRTRKPSAPSPRYRESATRALECSTTATTPIPATSIRRELGHSVAIRCQHRQASDGTTTSVPSTTMHFPECSSDGRGAGPSGRRARGRRSQTRRAPCLSQGETGHHGGSHSSEPTFRVTAFDHRGDHRSPRSVQSTTCCHGATDCTSTTKTGPSLPPESEAKDPSDLLTRLGNVVCRSQSSHPRWTVDNCHHSNPGSQMCIDFESILSANLPGHVSDHCQQQCSGPETTGGGPASTTTGAMGSSASDPHVTTSVRRRTMRWVRRDIRSS